MGRSLRRDEAQRERLTSKDAIMSRIPFIILSVLLSCAAGFGQTSYKGLTPGKSTKADVERVLGRITLGRR